MPIPALTKMIEHLVAEPSVSSVSPEWDQPNIRVIDILAEWFSALGFNIEKLPVPGCPGKFNLIASAGSGPEGLVLSGHTDTVPYDEHRWSSDPFKLLQQDERLYGLGTADMKSYFALVLDAVRDLDLEKLKNPLIILATADEESTMCGAKSLVDANHRLGRHAIIGEPTGLKPVRMHKGISMESIRLTGQSGHSSNPALGRNALDGMYQVMGEVLRWRGELQQKYHDPMFEVAFPTVNLGHIHGGDNPNRICAHCELHFDMRPLPGMDIGQLRSELTQRLATLMADSGLKLEHIPLFDGIPAMDTPATSAVVQAVENMTGYTAQAVAFGTEGPYLNQLGMETVILGPGHIDQAHQPNEYLALDQIEPGVKLIQRLIKRFCL